MAMIEAYAIKSICIFFLIFHSHVGLLHMKYTVHEEEEDV